MEANLPGSVIGSKPLDNASPGLGDDPNIGHNHNESDKKNND